MIDDTHAVLFSGLQHLYYLRARESERSVNHQPVWEHTNCSTISASPAISQCLRGRNPNNTTSVCTCMCAFYIILAHSMGVILKHFSHSWSSCIRNESLAKWALPICWEASANLFTAQCFTQIYTKHNVNYIYISWYPFWPCLEILIQQPVEFTLLHHDANLEVTKHSGHVVSFIQFHGT